MKTRVMVDLETLGTQPGCAILQIGAVRSNGDTFSAHIDWRSSERVGLRIEVDTLAWWGRHPAAWARQVAIQKESAHDIRDALGDFAEWLGEAGEIWGNPARFDLAILEAAYRACSLATPWAWRDERDFRTVCQLNDVVTREYPPAELAHDALEDALSQAAHLRKLGIWPPVGAVGWGVPGGAL